MLELNKIYLGDCLEVMKDIPDKSVNLIVIDPPYNIHKAEWDKIDNYIEWMGKVFIECQRVLTDNGSFYFFHNDFMQMVELQNWLNKNSKFVFKQLITWEKYQTNKQYYGRKVIQGINNKHKRNYFKMAEYCLFYTLQNNTGLDTIMLDINNFKTMRKYFKELQQYMGLSLKKTNTILGHRKAEHCFYWKSTQWDIPTKEVYSELIEKFNINRWEGFKIYDDLKHEYESLRLEYESLRYTFNFIKPDITTTFLIKPAKKEGHITPKPSELIETFIKHSTNENDIVLDCFIGSGTTAVACKNTNRNYIGIEKDKTYYDIACKRLEVIV
jgi:DNA modification methylase